MYRQNPDRFKYSLRGDVGSRSIQVFDSRRHRKANAPLRRRYGFTLIEALAAGMILAMVAVVIGTGLSQSIGSLRMARDYQVAAELLDTTLTKVDLIGADRIYYEGPTEGQFMPPHHGFSWQTKVESMLEGHLFEVTVQVSWSESSVIHQVEAHTRFNCQDKSHNPLLRWEDL